MNAHLANKNDYTQTDRLTDPNTSPPLAKVITMTKLANKGAKCLYIHLYFTRNGRKYIKYNIHVKQI